MNLVEIEPIQQLTFDYSSLDSETRAYVQEKAQAIQARLKRTAEDIIAIGQDLKEVKERLQHGQFTPWLQVEFGMNIRSAQRFILVAERFGKSDNLSYLPVSVLYELASPSVPDSVVDMVESGQLSTPVRSSLAALQSSESNEWYTPAEYIEAARELMGSIDLDPASCELANQVVQATKYYDKNGLLQSWRGHIWLNPPYGIDGGISNQELWSRTLRERYEINRTVNEAVLLVNANTEAKWFQPLYNYLICFTNHRIRFYNVDGESSQPTQGNALVYFGSQRKRFIEIFSRFGTVIEKAK